MKRELENFLHRANIKSVLLLPHQLSDPDSLCSAYALSKFLPKLKPGLRCEIAVKELNKLSKIFAKEFSIETIDNPSFNEYDSYILVDCSTVQQLGEDWKEAILKNKKPIIFVDHHAPHPETMKIATHCFVDESSTSTCEIVYRLLREAEENIDPTMAQALLIGICYDSRLLSLSNNATIKTIAELIDLGADVKKALWMLQISPDRSERIARLKGAMRSKMIELGKWLITYTFSSSHQGSIAKSLLELGANVAIVVGKVNDELRVSLRSDIEFFKETGIHLGKNIAEPLGTYIKGMGGGHSMASGAYGKGEAEDAVNFCIELFKEMLKN